MEENQKKVAQTQPLNQQVCPETDEQKFNLNQVNIQSKKEQNICEGQKAASGYEKIEMTSIN